MKQNYKQHLVVLCQDLLLKYHDTEHTACPLVRPSDTQLSISAMLIVGKARKLYGEFCLWSSTIQKTYFDIGKEKEI